MSGSLDAYLAEAAGLMEAARTRGLGPRMDRAIAAMTTALAGGKAILVCGNGGSASDAMHIAGELVARFLIDRPALKVIPLAANPAMLTAWANDVGYDTVFARQVEAYGEAGGVLIGLSTSGNSKSVLLALEAARKRGMTTVGFGGEGGGKMAPLCDILLDAPSRETPRIQEVHLALYHYLCREVEARMAKR